MKPIVVMICILIAVAVVLSLSQVERPTSAPSSAPALDRTAAVNMPTSNPAATTSAFASGVNLRRTPVVEVVDKTKDAVVYISSKKIVAQRNVPPGMEMWQDLFDFRYVPVGSLGSGFVIHPDGYIITNNHVIDRAFQISVELLDGRKFEDVELISADADADLAILKIKTDKPLPYLELGDSSDLMPGEPVVAVGNPFGFSHTVSQGIVSALHRDLKGDNGKVLFSDLIQTDAAINPGNSGGPLLNIYGQVIGINTAIRGDAQNIGFAIQVNKLRELIPELMSPSQAAKLDIPIKLTEKRTLTPPSNVAATVLRADGNVPVKTIAGQAPKDIVDAYAILLRQKPGKAFNIELQGAPAMKVDPKEMPRQPDAVVKAKQKFGLNVELVTKQIAEKYQLGVEDGIRIISVDRNSVGERNRLKAGDVILQIERFRVATLDDFGYILDRFQPGMRVFIAVLRDGQIMQGQFAYQP